MKPITISKNDYKISVILNCLNNSLELINSIKTEYETLNLRKLKDSDLSSLDSGERFLKDIITENVSNPEVQGVKISITKLREILELPANRHDFINLSNELLEYTNNHRRDGFDIRFYKIENDKVVLSKVEIDKMILQHSYIATTPKEHEFLQMAVKVLEVANESIKFSQKYGLFPVRFFTELNFIKFDSEENIYTIDGNYLLAKTK